jgi:hypothetical protein
MLILEILIRLKKKLASPMEENFSAFLEFV